MLDQIRKVEVSADNLTDKYTKSKWYDTTSGQLYNPNYALLMNEKENYRIFVMQGGTRCFSPKTKVVTDNGSKEFDTLRIGDRVKTFNEVTRKNEWQTINELLKTSNTKPTVRVTLVSGEYFVCNSDHEFYHDNSWVQIKHLLESNTLPLLHKWEYVKNDTCPEVYDLSINNNHNYYICCGEDEYLVHNSGKTYATIMFFWWLIINYSGLSITIIRQHMPEIKESVLKDFKNIGIESNVWDEKLFHKTEMKYVYNGNEVKFMSGEDEGKLRGVKSHFVYFNEAPEMKWESVSQVLMRNEGKIIMDYNPSYDESWIYDKILTRDKSEVCFLQTTYLDNPFVEEGTLAELAWMKENDPAKYIAFGLGERGEVQGQVYNNFISIKDEDFPKEAKVFIIDFGFNPDPTCITLCYQIDRRLYAHIVAYKTELSNIDIAILLYFAGYRNEEGFVLIADSASPSDISDLRFGKRYEASQIEEFVLLNGIEEYTPEDLRQIHSMLSDGLPVIGAIKGSGSILAGIKKVRECVVYLTASSVDGWNEYRMYKRIKSKATGEFTHQPIDKYNHFMDTLRYFKLALGRLFHLD